jgi:hypothetical protein
MPKKKKPSKGEVLIIDWDMYDHPDPEERRAYRLWLVLYHEASWGRNVDIDDLCRRLQCSPHELGASLTRLRDHGVVSTVGQESADYGFPHGLN